MLTVAEQPAPWILDGPMLVAVGGETGLEVDDVGAITDRGGFLVVQAKGALRLTSQRTGAFGEAIDQVVAQFIGGLPDYGREDLRPIDVSRDRLVVAGDGRSSQPVRELSTVTSRLRTLPEAMPIPSAATSAVQRTALATLLGHIRAAWSSAACVEPGEAEVRRLLRVLVVDVLDLAEDGAHRATAMAHLRSVLLDAARDMQAWTALRDLGAALARGRAWRRRVDIAASLDAAGAPIGPAGRHAADIQTLRRLTEAATQGLAAHSSLPTAAGPVHCDRSAIDELAAADGSFVVVGDPGCGKSGVIYELARRLAVAEDVVVLTVDTLPRTSAGVRTELGLVGDLLETFRAWSGAGRATLLLDGLDAARGEGTTWLTTLCDSLVGSRWRVIASMRRFDLRHSVGWQKAFSGEPLRPGSEHEADDLALVRHYLLGDLSDDDLAHIASASSAVARLLSGASPGLADLVRNPFNLRLAIELLNAGASVASLADTRDQLQLLERYWRLRVVDAPAGTSRVRVLASLTWEMLQTRRLRASSSVVPDTLLDGLDELLHDGVLHEAPPALLADASSVVLYSHHILFDFAVAAIVLTSGGDSRLAEALSADPNLEVVARPSLDLHLADVWHADPGHETFARVIRDLVAADHPVAGVAAARVATEHVSAPADVAWLAAMFAGDAATATTVTAWICGAMDAADPRLVDGLAAAMSAWARVTTAAVETLEAAFDPTTGQTLFRLLLQLDTIETLTPSARAAAVRAESAARLMELCLTAPAERGWLASRVARFLPAAVTVDPAVGETIRRSIEEATLAICGAELLRQYVEGIEILADGDPDTATEVMLTVWTWGDESDETTYIARGVLNLTSTRKQDFDDVRWLCGEKFTPFVERVGLHRATAVVAAVLHAGHNYNTDGDPIEAFGAHGTLWPVAGDLQYSDGHGASVKIVESFLATLAATQLDEEQAEQVMKAMIESIAHPEFWRRLLDAAATIPEWRLRVAPVLASGALLKDSETRAAAGRLMKSLTAALDARDHEELLETPIRRAADLYEEDMAKWREQALDQLLGCLEPGHVQGADLRSRLEAILARGGPSTIPEPADVDLSWQPTDLQDIVGADVHATLTTAAKAALDELRRALHKAQEVVPDECVAALAPALCAAVKEAGSVDAGPVQELITRAADRLSQASSVVPGTAVGDLVVDLVLAAAEER
ncbi:MAG: hypothetical protein M3Q48_02690 [Actinomycetota bacterium]|nr:hypothetical protein [Actinomycetota bacterium]